MGGEGQRSSAELRVSWPANQQVPSGAHKQPEDGESQRQFRANAAAVLFCLRGRFSIRVRAIDLTTSRSLALEAPREGRRQRLQVRVRRECVRVCPCR